MIQKIPKIALLVVGLTGLALAAVVVALVASGGDGPGEAANPAAGDGSPVAGHLTEQPAERRTVLVSNGREPAPSPPGEMLHAQRLKGSMPRHAVPGTVMTDEECAPDAEGVSHCINRLRLPNGKILVVRHPHRMMEVPCLSPGEHVMVRAASS